MQIMVVARRLKWGRQKLQRETHHWKEFCQKRPQRQTISHHTFPSKRWINMFARMRVISFCAADGKYHSRIVIYNFLNSEFNLYKHADPSLSSTNHVQTQENVQNIFLCGRYHSNIFLLLWKRKRSAPTTGATSFFCPVCAKCLFVPPPSLLVNF